MKTRDWESIVTAKGLLIGEHSTLQWKDEVPDYPMFIDYYFDHAPYDLGLRSRYMEAKVMLDTITEITDSECRAQQLHCTLLSKEPIPRPPKGKHTLIPESHGKAGVEHIKSILKKNPSIKYIFALGMQTNYYLQKHGLLDLGDLAEEVLHGCQPRRVGISSIEPYYQPVDAKVFRKICFKRYPVIGYKGVEVIPMLPMKSYPLSDGNIKNFGANFDQLKSSFR